MITFQLTGEMRESTRPSGKFVETVTVKKAELRRKLQLEMELARLLDPALYHLLW
jgi:hypothetical protein